MKTCFCLLIFLSTAAFSQTAQITGLVSDPTGTAVPEAQVTVTNSETGIRHTSTNAQSYYTVPLLNPGRYQLSVQKTGFKAVTRPEIKLDVAQIARVDVGLELGEVKDAVTVVGEAPILSLSSSYSFNQGQTYNSGQFAANGATTNTVRKQRLGLSETHSFNPSTINEFTNTPAFGSPTGNIQSANAGKILSAGEPRDIQFALKLSF
jgi:hypothetical protein